MDSSCSSSLLDPIRHSGDGGSSSSEWFVQNMAANRSRPAAGGTGLKAVIPTVVAVDAPVDNSTSGDSRAALSELSAGSEPENRSHGAAVAGAASELHGAIVSGSGPKAMTTPRAEDLPLLTNTFLLSVTCSRAPRRSSLKGRSNRAPCCSFAKTPWISSAD